MQIPVQKPYKTREAQLVALWLSVPFIVHGLEDEKLKKLGYDLEDGDLAKVIGCKTRSELAKALGVTRQQIKRWEDSEWMTKKVSELNMSSNVLRFKQDIDWHFTQRTIRQGTAADVKAWHQIYMGWTEGSRNQSNGADSAAMMAGAAVIRAMAERKE